MVYSIKIVSARPNFLSLNLPPSVSVLAFPADVATEGLDVGVHISIWIVVFPDTIGITQGRGKYFPVYSNMLAIDLLVC